MEIATAINLSYLKATFNENTAIINKVLTSFIDTLFTGINTESIKILPSKVKVCIYFFL